MAVLLVSGLSCGRTTDSPNASGGTAGAAACVPGVQVACACASGKSGAQACRADGTGFGACRCSSPADGGSSGAGVGGAHPTAGATSAGTAGEAGAVGESEAGAGGEGGELSGSATDFPAQPILADGVPANAPDLFAAAEDTRTSPLCVLEPQLSSGSAPGAMFPSNWLRPRFRVAATDLDLYQIRLHSAAEVNDLVVYTKQKTWYLPKDIWHGSGSKAGLGVAAAGSTVEVTVRALDTNAPLTATRVSGSFSVAPAVATGSILYSAAGSWTLTPNSNQVFGFSVGDESAQSALTLSQVAWAAQLSEDGAVPNGYYDAPKLAGFLDGQVRRITYPALTPDAQSLVFSDGYPYALGMSALSNGSVGAIPPYVGKGAAGMLRMPWLGSSTLSPAHWASNDRTLVSSYGTTFKSGQSRTKPWQPLPSYAGTDGATVDDLIKWHQLAWFDLEASFAITLLGNGGPEYGAPLDARNAAVAAAKGSSWGLIATGDTNVSDVSPSFNPVADTLVYVATDYSPEGHPDATATTADVRLVPYNARAGGVSQPLQGAADPSAFEYEPAFSSDGKLVAFTRAASGGPDGPFRNRQGQVTVVSANGGTPTPLVANEPNLCAGDPTPLALLNGSPAWSPNALHRDGRTYYFLVFTSARKYGDEFASQFQLGGTDNTNTLRDSTQLYLTTVVVDDTNGSITSFPAIYIWNQNRFAASNSVPISFASLTPVWGTTVLAPSDVPPVP